jgi:hypothetical protein
MKNYLSLLVIICLLLQLKPAKADKLCAPGTVPDNRTISAYAIDTIHDIIYIGGEFNVFMDESRKNLAAIDANTGALLPWNPTTDGKVTSLVFANNSVIIAGLFNNVNGQSTGKMACLLPDGLLNQNWKASSLELWQKKPGEVEFIMDTDGSNVYLSGDFDLGGYWGMAVISPVTGNIIGNPAQEDFYGDFMEYTLSFRFADDNIYSLSESILKIFDGTTRDLIKKIDLKPLCTPVAKDFVIHGDVVYLYGNFTINSVTYQAVALNTVTGQLLNWKLDVSRGAACNGKGVSCQGCWEVPFTPVINTMWMHNGQLLLGGNMFDQTDQNKCKSGSTYWVDANTIDSLYTFNSPAIFNRGTDYMVRDFFVYKNRLYLMSRTREGYYNNLCFSNRDTIASFCLPPAPPQLKSGYKTEVCPGTSKEVYRIASPVAGAEYGWHYSGFDASMLDHGDYVEITFGMNATSGWLTFYKISDCGPVPGVENSIQIKLLPKPYASAGEDKTLNCKVKSIILTGNATDGPVSWTGPNGIKNNFYQLTTSTPGGYVYTVTDQLTGCTNSDVAVVKLDTATIKPLPYKQNTVLTCKVNSLILDASSLYPNDSLRWLYPNATVNKNPAPVVSSGAYKLIIYKKSNGCESSSVVNVTTNYTPPALSLSKTTFVITCYENPVLLDGDQTAKDVVVKWKTPDGDTLKKPAYATKAGVYMAIATDTTTGCSKSQTVTVIENLTPPDALLPVPLPEVNCSTDSAFLAGSSSFKNVDIYWIAADGEFKNDSTWVKDTGLYVLHVINKDNGCVAENSFQLIKSNTLLINAKDTSVCNGSSVLLKVSPVKGTPAFSYLWENGLKTPTITVAPKDTTIYKVSVSDAAGCAGTAAVKVKPAPALMDSVKTFQSCDPAVLAGELQVYGYGGRPPYTYSADGGLHWQDKKIFSKIPYGHYDIVIKDAMGCFKKDTASISKLSSTVDVNFLVATNLFKTDTFIVVDISNPRPDSVSWDFPAECTLINKDPFAPMLVNKDTGAFTITMHAHYQSCERIVSKKVKIIPMDSAFIKAKGKFGIEEVKAYPNPTNGAFSCEIKLYVPQDVAVMMYDPNAQEIYRHVTPNTDDVIEKIDLQSAGNGYYVLKIIAEHDARSVLIMVQQ